MEPKTHHLIFSLLLDITPGPDAKPGELCRLVVPLKRDGNSAGRNGGAAAAEATVGIAGVRTVGTRIHCRAGGGCHELLLFCPGSQT
jgi:hypothetical protein